MLKGVDDGGRRPKSVGLGRELRLVCMNTARNSAPCMGFGHFMRKPQNMRIKYFLYALVFLELPYSVQMFDYAWFSTLDQEEFNIVML